MTMSLKKIPGVHSVPAHGLEGDLAGEGRIEAGVEHPGPHPQLAVFGQRAPRLTHEPDRGHLLSHSLIGTDEGSGCGAPGAERMGTVEGVHPLILPKRLE